MYRILYSYSYVKERPRDRTERVTTVGGVRYMSPGNRRDPKGESVIVKVYSVRVLCYKFPLFAGGFRGRASGPPQ